jgi:hypothetical protein
VAELSGDMRCRLAGVEEDARERTAQVVEAKPAALLRVEARVLGSRVEGLADVRVAQRVALARLEDVVLRPSATRARGGI